jgi:hypothetical protein
MADRYANAIVADLDVPQSLRQRAKVILDIVAPLLSAKTQK